MAEFAVNFRRSFTLGAVVAGVLAANLRLGAEK
jgi:hypothetical protein